MSTIQTLRPSEPMLSTSLAKNSEIKLKTIETSLIAEDYLCELGGKAFLVKLYDAQVEEILQDPIKQKALPISNTQKPSELFKKLTVSQQNLCRTIGILVQCHGELFYMKAETFRGASGLVTDPTQHTAKNMRANERAKSELNNKAKNWTKSDLPLFHRLVEGLIEIFNNHRLVAHKEKFVPFIVTLLGNQKLRTFGHAPNEIKKYDAIADLHVTNLVSKFENIKLSNEEQAFVVKFNKKLFSELEHYIRTEKNGDSFSREYLSELLKPLTGIPLSFPVKTGNTDSDKLTQLLINDGVL